MNQVILRLLATTPPGKLAFTIIDPVGLGQNFAGLMHLADYEESLINRRIWTQRDQIEERLAELNEHIEKVIQMYLRNEYATITEYNAQAGSVAEKYHFLVVADFPANFSETAAKRLQSIATSGPRCGVFTLIHWDQRQPLPDGFVAGRAAQEQRLPRAAKTDAFVVGREQIEAGADAGLRSAARRRNSPPRSSTRSARRASTRTASRCPSRRSRRRRTNCGRATRRTNCAIAIGRTGATKHPVSRHRQRHAPARALRRQDRLRQIHALPRHHHQPRALVQPGAGRVLPHRLQEGRRVQVLRHAAAAARARRRHRERSRVRPERAAARGRGTEAARRPVPQARRAGHRRLQDAPAAPSRCRARCCIIDEFQEFFVEDDTHRADRVAALRPHRAPGPRLRHPRAARLADARRRLHAGPRHARPDGHPRRAPVQRGRRLSHHGREQLRAAPALASRRRHLQRRRRRGRGQQPVPGRLAPRRGARRAGSTKSARSPSERARPAPGPIVFEGNAPADVRENDLLRRRARHDARHRARRRALLARRAEFDQGPDRSRLPPPERQPPAHRRPARRGRAHHARRSRCSRSPRSIPPGSAKFVFFHSATPGSPDAAFLEQHRRSPSRTASPSRAATRWPTS